MEIVVPEEGDAVRVVPSPVSRTASTLEIEPGNLTNLGFLIHEAIVHNDARRCSSLLGVGFPLDKPLKYLASTPDNSPRSVEDRNQYEFQGTALHVACIYRRDEIVRLLLEHSADPNVVDKFGRTPVILAVTYWPRVFLTTVSRDSPDENRYHDYLLSLHDKSLSCLRSLCEFGADVNKSYGKMLETPLHLAARYHLLKCVQVLLSYGADVNACDVKGMTPLHCLCSRATRNTDGETILTLLLNQGAKVDSCDGDGNAPLHCAAINGCGTFIRKLVSFGANPDRPNSVGLTPLFLLLDDVRNVGCITGLSVILNESTYVKILDQHHHLPALLIVPELEGVRSALLLASRVPPTLKLLCRQVIRRAIGVRNVDHEAVEQLPCPRLLRNMILSEHTFNLEEENYGEPSA